MSSNQTADPGRTYTNRDDFIPRTTLKIPMPAGATPPPPAPNAKPSSSEKSK